MPDDLSRRETVAALVALGMVGCKTRTAVSAAPRNTDVLRTDTDVVDTDVLDTDRCMDRTGAQTAGPFYPGEPVARLDITAGRAGVRLRLDLRIVLRGSCAPLVGAEVDCWCADAVGAYSGYAEFQTVGLDFLRGQQITDSDGRAHFLAIVPGSYPGRAVHLHIKVRAPGITELTTQVYLPDDLAAEALAQPAYVGGAAQTPNAVDNFYAPDTLLTATGSAANGVQAEIELVV